MDTISFGCYEAIFKNVRSGRKMVIAPIAKDGCPVASVNLKGLIILHNREDEVSFKKGWFTYFFTFKEFTPGLYKIKYMSRLFGKIPFFRFSGEIGDTYKTRLVNEILSCNKRAGEG